MDIFHKLPHALSLAGRFSGAQRLVQGVARDRGFTSAGAVNFYLEPVQICHCGAAGKVIVNPNG